MTSSKCWYAASVVKWCCFVSILMAAASRDCNAQDGSPSLPLAAELDALEEGSLPTSPMADEAAMCGTCCEPVCCCPWQVRVNALFLTRSSQNAIFYLGPKGERLEERLDSGFAWGPSVGLSFCPNTCNPQTRIGVEFFAVDGWNSTSQVAGNISVQFPSLPYLPELIVPGDPSSGYGVATFDYRSNLYNTEFNIYRQSSSFCWLTTLAGFRWIEIGEEYSAVFTTGATTPNFAIDANNHLYGLQIGALAKLDSYGPWRFDSWLKAGVYANSADQDTMEDFSSAGGQVIFASARSSNVAFVGDVGVSVSRRITDRLSLRFSYMALWIEGIALAPEQLDNSDPSSSIANLDHSGGTFYHGGFIGGEFLW